VLKRAENRRRQRSTNISREAYPLNYWLDTKKLSQNSPGLLSSILNHPNASFAYNILLIKKSIFLLYAVSRYMFESGFNMDESDAVPIRWPALVATISTRNVFY
jgi:hypothetical protein